MPSPRGLRRQGLVGERAELGFQFTWLGQMEDGVPGSHKPSEWAKKSLGTPAVLDIRFSPFRRRQEGPARGPGEGQIADSARLKVAQCSAF